MQQQGWSPRRELVRAEAFANSVDDEGAVTAIRIAREVASRASDEDVRQTARLAVERYAAKADAWNRSVEARFARHVANEQRSAMAGVERDVPRPPSRERRGLRGWLESLRPGGHKPPEAILEHAA